MKQIFARPEGLTQNEFSYCPGCIHSIVHRLIGELMEEMDLLDNTVGVCPVGCAVFMYDYMACDMIEASHGRAPAVATGVKRVIPDKFVWVYQGDGDLASIGMCETVHAAARGENISVIFINNSIYGMTGGQMAPTTLIGQKATTCPSGRTAEQAGYPIKVCELLNTLDAPVYIERVSPIDPAGIRKTKKAIKHAFELQLAGKGYSFVEVLSNCPTQWKMSALDSLKYVEEHTSKIYPVGVFRDIQE